MTASPVPYHPPVADPQVAKRNSLTTWAWLMIPASLFVMFPVAFVIGSVLLGLRDLEGSEPMSEQGLYGWFVMLLTLGIFVIPQVLGIVFGTRARRLGARGGALAAVIVNAAILIGLPIIVVVGALNQ